VLTFFSAAKALCNATLPRSVKGTFAITLSMHCRINRLQLRIEVITNIFSIFLLIDTCYAQRDEPISILSATISCKL